MQDERAWVVRLVGTMPKPEQYLLPGETFGDPRIGPIGGADRIEHVGDLAWRTTVNRALQGRESGGRGAREVGLGRDRHAERERRGVHPVVREQDEVGFEGPHPRGVRLPARDHGQVVGGVGQVGPRGHGREPTGPTDESSEEDRGLRDEAESLFEARWVAEAPIPECGEDGAERLERWKVGRQRVHHPFHRGRRDVVLTERGPHLGRRVLRGRLTEQEQMDRGLIGDPRHEVPYIETSVDQVARLAPDPRDRGAVDHDMVEALRDRGRRRHAFAKPAPA